MDKNYEFAAELLGRVVKSKRASLEMKQSELAEKLGVDQRKISDWESGRVKKIPKQYWDKLFELLDIEPEKDFTGIEFNLDIPTVSSSEYNLPHVKAGIKFLKFIINDTTDMCNEFRFLKREVNEYELRNEMRELLELFFTKHRQIRS